MSACVVFFFFQAEDGIRDLVRSRGLGDVYKRQGVGLVTVALHLFIFRSRTPLAIKWLASGSLALLLSLIHI